MIRLVNVNKKYGSRVIFKNLSFSFENNGLYILKGYNGVGKTTLLNILDLMDNEYEGTIYFNDVDIKKLTEKGKQKFRKESISYLFPSGNLISYLSLKDNLLLDSPIENASLIQDIDLDRLPNKISGGQEMLVSLQKVFNQGKKLVLLDEVTSQLDDDNTYAVLEKLVDLANNSVVILVTHDRRILRKKDLRIYEVREGEII